MNLLDIIHMVLRWHSERKYCLIGLIRDGEITLRDEIHPYQNIYSIGYFASGNPDIRKTNIIGQYDIHQISR